MAFYRTYRPQVIDEIDNKDVHATFLSLLSKERLKLPHAFFFSGPKGSGKTTAARIIAKLFLCEKMKKSGPCGTCAACVSVASGTALDVIEIDAASNRGIDDIRALRDGIGLTPSAGEFKIYIIDEVHMLTNEAFNALLKTLEEPPSHAVFVLATTDPQKVPSTILSRCMHVKFSRAGTSVLIDVLLRIAKKEKMHVDPEIIALIAEVADGSFRDAVKILEQVSFLKTNVTISEIRTLLSVPDQAIKNMFLKALIEKNVKACLEIIHQLGEDGSDIKQFTTNILYTLEEQLVHIASGDETKSSWSQERILFVIDEFSRAFLSFRYTPILALPVEVAVVNICKEESVVEAVSLRQAHSARIPDEVSIAPASTGIKSLGLLTYERLVEHWSDVIAAAKPTNHSVAGVLRSARPLSVEGSVVRIEAFYPFHQEKLSEPSVRALLSTLLKQLFGENVTVEIVLGKK